jgi:hypothetical protein
MLQKALVSILKNFIYRRNFTNKVRVCCATLSRRISALPDPKQESGSEISLIVGSGVGSETNHSGSTTL